MKRLLTTTAFLLVTSPVYAQDAMNQMISASSVSGEEARQISAREKAAQPQIFTILKGEIESGIAVNDLTCSDGAAPPCQDGAFLLTPMKVAVGISRDGMLYPLSAEFQTATQEADAPASVAAEPEVQNPVLAEMLRTDAQKDADLVRQERAQEEQAPDPVPEDVVDNVQPITPDVLDAPVPEPTDSEMAESSVMEEIVKEPVVEATDAPVTVPDMAQVENIVKEEPSVPTDDEIAKMLENDAPPIIIREGDTIITNEEPPLVSGAINDADVEEIDAEPVQELVVEPPEPEIMTVETVEDDVVPVETVDAVSTPEEDVPVIETVEDDVIPVENAVVPVAEPATVNVPVVETIAEHDDITPATAATLEALSDDASGEVSEESLTGDTVRSSSEDFETKVSGKSDKSDDVKSLLYGLGGFALGTMLSNDREVVLNTGDRVIVVNADGTPQVIKDDAALFMQEGYTIKNEKFADGSSRVIATSPDGTQIVTIRDADMRVIRRIKRPVQGQQVVLIDDTVTAQPVVVSQLPPPVKITMQIAPDDSEMIRQILLTKADFNRTFTLDQVRTIPEVRDLVAPVQINNITFDTGSSAIKPDQAKTLTTLGKVIKSMIEQNPREVFLIEGHTDSVGRDETNLALSDRRAESVAKALIEYFGVPAENLVIQGYGERYLLVKKEGYIRDNRRTAVRRITDLIAPR